MRFTLVSFMPVAHGRSELPTTSAVAEGGKANILWLVMTVPKMQQANSIDPPKAAHARRNRESEPISDTRQTTRAHTVRRGGDVNGRSWTGATSVFGEILIVYWNPLFSLH